MAQSVVTVRLNGQPYQMGCGPGEEAHIEALAKEVDEIISAVKADAGQLGDSRLLAMAALILADQKHALQSNGAAPQPALAQTAPQSDAIAQQIDEMTTKLKALNTHLENIR